MKGNNETTAVFGVEGPSFSGSSSCTDADRAGDHSNFNGNGEHITHVAETELRNTSTVFAFHSHVVDDSDRCLNLGNIDRIRTEIKGGPEGHTDPELEHGYGTISHYRWQMRLDEDFAGTNRFTHLFQLKPVGGPDVTIPMVTLTARTNDLEINHFADGTAAGDYRDGDKTELDDPSLSNFRGEWVEIYVKVIHRNANDGGELTVRINNVQSGEVVSDETRSLDMWRGATNGTDYLNRPKWGIYRGLADGFGQQDEIVRFANFCSSENGDLCPSLLPGAVSTELVGSAADRLVLSPNPTSDLLTIGNLPASDFTYRVVALTGQVVADGELPAGTDSLRLPALAAGIYLLQLRNGAGELLPVRRFVVQR